jgi:chromate transport protein ChrA
MAVAVGVAVKTTATVFCFGLVVVLPSNYILFLFEWLNSGS